MVRISEEVLDRNRHFLTPDTDYWLGQRVSRGVDAVGDEGWEHTGPNVIVECIPLPLKARARLFRDGIDIVVPPTRRVSPDMLSPRAKTHNYLNLITADLEAKAQDKEAWSVLLDAQGHLAEGIGSNIFLVRDGAVMTPHERWVLPGVSRETVFELCGELGIECREADLDLFDAANADEIFMTSTSLCICPVRSIAGRDSAGSRPRTGDATDQRRLCPPRRLRLCCPVPEASGLSRTRETGAASAAPVPAHSTRSAQARRQRSSGPEPSALGALPGALAAARRAAPSADAGFVRDASFVEAGAWCFEAFATLV